jgi:hypothetical protein
MNDIAQRPGEAWGRCWKEIPVRLSRRPPPLEELLAQGSGLEQAMPVLVQLAAATHRIYAASCHGGFCCLSVGQRSRL